MGHNNSPEHINGQINNFSVAKTVVSKADTEKKLGLTEMTAYINADAFVGNPYSLLGRVIEVRKGPNGAIPSSLAENTGLLSFSIASIVGFEEDKNARLSAPLRRDSVIVNKQLSLSVGFLNFLSSQFEQKSAYSIEVLDQAVGLVNTATQGWMTAVNEWKMNNGNVLNAPDICYVFAVIGFVEKYIIRKKYDEYSANAKGGAYGLNLEGKLYTGTDAFDLDIIFGLTPAVLKRPATKALVGLVDQPPWKLDAHEAQLFSSIKQIGISKFAL